VFSGKAGGLTVTPSKKQEKIKDGPFHHQDKKSFKIPRDASFDGPKSIFALKQSWKPAAF
jgi:hypothetical protein